MENEYDEDLNNPDFRGVWIPKILWLNTDLTPTEKVFLMEINSYQSGQCWKSNKTLGKFMSMAEKSISRLVKRMVDKGLLSSTMKTHSHGSVRILQLTKRGLTMCGERSNVELPPSSPKVTQVIQDSNTSKSNKTSTKVESKKIDWDKLIEFINKTTGREFRVINKSIKARYLTRLKDGYRKEDIINAVKEAVKVKSHKENGFSYLTPEFFSRAETLDKYGVKAAKGNGSEEGGTASSISVKEILG